METEPTMPLEGSIPEGVADIPIEEGPDIEPETGPPPQTPEFEYKVKIKHIIHHNAITGQAKTMSNDELRWDTIYAHNPDHIPIVWAEQSELQLLKFPPGQLEVVMQIWGPQSDVECMPYEIAIALVPRLVIIGITDRHPVGSSLQLGRL